MEHVSLRRRVGRITAVAAALVAMAPLGAPPAGAQDDPTKEPFLCTTQFNGLGQPKVDNDDRKGTPVYP